MSARVCVSPASRRAETVLKPFLNTHTHTHTHEHTHIPSVCLFLLFTFAPFCLGAKTAGLFPPPVARVTGSAALINSSRSESRSS